MLKTFFYFLLFLLVAIQSQAGALDKQSAGFRFTDNVYLMPEEKKSDVYLLVNSRAKFFMENRTLTFRLDVADYSKENANDSLGLNLLSRSPFRGDGALRSTDLLLKAFHKNYFQGDAATSDTSFTHTGLGAELEKEWLPRTDLNIVGSAGYEGRYFHNLGGRNDHQFSLLADVDFNGSSRVTPYVSTGLGWVISSQAAYSAMFVDLGGGAKGPLVRDWMWFADLGLKSTSYVNRTIDQVIEVTRGRGNGNLAVTTEREQTQSLTTSAGLQWELKKNWDFESRLNMTNQTSNNPNFAYQNNELFFTLSYRP